MDFSDLGDTTSTSTKKGKFDFSDLGDISKNSQDSTQGEQRTSQLQQIAEQINIPSRMGRSAGVGIGLASEATGLSPANVLPSNSIGIEQVAQLLKALQNPQQALAGIGNAASRAGQAFKPGFKPTEQEKPYSQIGEVAGNIATGAALGGATAGLGTLPGLASDAAISGGLNALTQAQSKGEINPTEVGVNAAIPVGVAGIGKSIGFIAKAFPKIASFFSKEPVQAFEKIAEDPQFLTKYKGTLDSIEERKNDVIKAFDDVASSLKKDFDNIGKTYGVKYIEGTPRPIAEIEAEFAQLQKATNPKLTKTIESGLVDQSGKAITREVAQKPIPEADKLQKLLNLDRDLNATTGGSFDDVTYTLKQKIQSNIKKLPGGQRLQYVRDRYSDFLELKNNLGKNLTDPLQAPTIFEKIVQGDIKGALSGPNAKKLAALKELEKYGKKDILEPLRNEILAKSLRKFAGAYSPRGIIGKAIVLTNPVLGAAEYAVGSPTLMAGVTKGLNQFRRNALPYTRDTGLSLGLGLGQRRRQE